MNILVCVKQVPDTTEIKIDPVTNTLIRSGVPSIVNPYDMCALEAALRLKESAGGSVTVLSMGPEQAKEALKTCLAVGADEAVLVSDRAFGGSDTLATSFILSAAVTCLGKRKAPYDLILCGKQAIDGDTAQVGPELSEHLNLPQITYASDVMAQEGKVVVKRESDDGYDMILTELPAVVTVVKTPQEPRLPSVKGRMRANKAVIATLNLADLEIDPERCGLKGSPTKVKKTFTPQRNKSGLTLQGKSAADSAQELVRLLSTAKIL